METKMKIYCMGHGNLWFNLFIVQSALTHLMNKTDLGFLYKYIINFFCQVA